MACLCGERGGNKVESPLQSLETLSSRVASEFAKLKFALLMTCALAVAAVAALVTFAAWMPEAPSAQSQSAPRVPMFFWIVGFAAVCGVIACAWRARLQFIEVSALIRNELFIPLERLLLATAHMAARRLDMLPEPRGTGAISDAHEQLLGLARSTLGQHGVFEAGLAFMGEALLFSNAAGEIQQWNDSAVTLLGYAPLELRGMPIESVFPSGAENLSPWPTLKVKLLDAGLVEDPAIECVTRDGRVFPVRVRAIALRNESGVVIGTLLFLADARPARQAEADAERLRVEVSVLSAELARVRETHNADLSHTEDRRRALEVEIETSKLVQDAFLPRGGVSHPRLDVFGAVLPAGTCAGDWWQVVSLPDRYYIFIGDVTGHGTASAMVTAAVAGYTVSVREVLEGGVSMDVGDILAGFNTVLSGMARGERDYHMTCFACMFDFQRRLIRFASAGHNAPLVFRPSTGLSVLTAHGARPGEQLGSREFQPEGLVREMPLTGDETFLFYTDGLVENKNTRQEPFGRRRLHGFLQRNSPLPCEELGALLLKEVRAHAPANRLEDDVTFVLARPRSSERPS